MRFKIILLHLGLSLWYYFFFIFILFNEIRTYQWIQIKNNDLYYIDEIFSCTLIFIFQSRIQIISGAELVPTVFSNHYPYFT